MTAPSKPAAPAPTPEVPRTPANVPNPPATPPGRAQSSQDELGEDAGTTRKPIFAPRAHHPAPPSEVVQQQGSTEQPPDAGVRDVSAVQSGEIATIADQPLPVPLAPPRANHPHQHVDPPAPAPTNVSLRGAPNNSIPNRSPVPARTVNVRLIWPAVRGAKHDDRGGTDIIWNGQGDVQAYPADKWRFLQPHPDVWELVDDNEDQVARQAVVNRIESPQERLVRLQRDRGYGITGIEDPYEAQRIAAQRAKDRAAELGTDAVVVGPSMGRPSTEHAPTLPVPEVNRNQLAPNTYDAAALAPHTQTAELEAAAHAASDAEIGLTTPTPPLAPTGESPRPDEFDPPPDPEKAAAVGKPTRAAVQKPKHLSPEDLDKMNEADIHVEAQIRGFELHPRLNPTNLRARFLEAQADQEG